MTEQEFDGLLAACLDGRLDEEQARTLDEGLRADPVLLRRAGSLYAVECLLRAGRDAEGFGAGILRSAQAPDGREPSASETADRVMAGLGGGRAQARTDPTRRAALDRWLAAAAAGLIIAAGVWAGLSVFRPVRPPEPKTAANRLLAGRVSVDGAEPGGAEIRNGAMVRVLGEGPAEIRLADGSVASLAPGSLAVLRGPAGGVRQVVELGGGRGDFNVETMPGQFKVETPVGSVTVTGTKFWVELRPKETEGKPEGGTEMSGKLGLALAVAVAVGTVEVSYDGRDHTLTAGMERVFAGGDAKPEPAKPPKVDGGQPQGEVVVGKKQVFSDKPVETSFSGEVGKVSPDGYIKVVPTKLDGTTEWKQRTRKGGEEVIRIKVGERFAIFADGDTAEGKAARAFFALLRNGDKIEGGLYFSNGQLRACHLTVTARAEEKKREPKEGEEKKRDGDAKADEGKKSDPGKKADAGKPEGEKPPAKDEGGGEF